MLVPYSTHHEVERPFGLTVPETVALVAVTPEAGPVTTLGGGCVVNDASAPAVVPASLTATSRKW